MVKKHYGWRIGEAPAQIGAHSLAKHRILQRYIERYIEIVTSNLRQEELKITFVDGFSGGGLYQFDDGYVPGSPVILLETVAAMEEKINAARTKGFRIDADFFFIDINPNHTDYLRAEIEKTAFASELDKSIRIWTGDFNEYVGTIIDFIRAKTPRAQCGIFLLDQYGWSQVAFQSVRAIMSELAKAEVFLTFSVDAMIDYLSEHNHNLRAFGEIDVDPGFVRELLKVKDEHTGYRSLIQNALYGHIQKETGSQFYSPFFIKSPEAHRSYWFLHLSKDKAAREEIGVIHWNENCLTSAPMEQISGIA